MIGFSMTCKSKNLIKELELIKVVYEIIEQKSATAGTVTQ